MRIITGKHKGRPLKAVPGNTTRPTADKVKEAAFQMMGPFFNGGLCLDLFAGSGALGCEAISRGMDKCVFIDQSKSAIHTIRTNIATIGISDQALIHQADAHRAIGALGNQNNQFDLIFLDPPYQKVNYTTIIELLMKHNLLNDHATLFCEHDPEENLPESGDKLSILKQTQYSKTTAITIYQFSCKGEQAHE